MIGDLLRHFQLAAVLQIRRDTGRAESMIANQGTREIRVILYAKEPSYVPRLDTRVNPSDFAGAPPVA